MLVKTRGIVLNFIKFKETSIIARVYTEQLGLQSYIVNSVRKKGPGSRIALFQPFTVLDMVVYTSPKGGITRISEYKCHYPFRTIPFNIIKSSILLFLSEVVSHTVKEEEENPALFEFLYRSVLTFDTLESGYENFHLQFLIGLAFHLGFGPESGNEIVSQVVFSGGQSAGQQSPAVIHFQLFEGLLNGLIRDPEHTNIPNGRLRKELLQILIRYYQLHIDKLGEIRSLQVLSDVLAE